MTPIDELIDAHFDDRLDDAGLAELQAWLRADDANRQRFLRESALRGELKQVLALRPMRLAPERRWPSHRAMALAAALVLSAILGLVALRRGNDPVIVTITAIDGTAVSGDRPLRAGDRIETSMALATDRMTEVAIALGDGSRLVLGPDARLRRGDGEGPAWHLDRGHLEASFARQPGGRPCVIRTPSTDVVVTGTVFDLAVAGPATHLRMEEGHVRLRPTAGGEVECRSGQVARADTSGIHLQEVAALVDQQPQPPITATPSAEAFAGATGFGAVSRGGRGGRVIPVTTLADDGPGSLRAAVEATGPRIVTFGIAGTIALAKPLRIREGRITIAGQTAPGDGICLRNQPIEIGVWDDRTATARPCDEVIIRHLRIRPGDAGPDGNGGNHVNGLSITAGSRIIIDHCSISWTGNKALRTGLADKPHDLVRQVTIQDCLIAEALHATTGQGPRGFAALMGGTDVSMHRNVFAHVYSYAPKPCGDGVFDFRNNLVYNWVHKGCGYLNDAADSLLLNYFGNQLRTGPDSPPETMGFRSMVGVQPIGVHDVAFVRRSGTVNSNIPALMVSTTGQRLTSRAHPAPAFPLAPARSLAEVLLPTVGACRPRRDAVDARICAEVLAQTGRVISTMRGQRDWPELRSAPAPADGDGDGIPDDEERRLGLDPADASDAARSGPDGRSALDRYLDACATTTSASRN